MSEPREDRMTVIQPALAAQWGRLLASIILVVVFLFMLGAGVIVLLDDRFADVSGIALAVFLLGVAGFIGWLSVICVRDLRGHWNWRAEVLSNAVELKLPSGRSLVHALPPINARIPFSEIERMECRLEAYSSLWFANMHRVYALRMTDGTLLVLGEDRALGTDLASSLVGRLAKAIVDQSELPVHDLGMAQGRAGLMMVAFQAPPRWDEPPLAPARQAELWRAAGLTGAVASAAPFTTLIG